MNVLDQFKLDGKLALVTGCKSGIGKAMTLGLAEAGADIIGVSSTLEESGSEIEQGVKALGRNFKAYQCDFSDRQALYAFISKVRADYPVIDILLSNAGTAILADPVDFPDEYWDKIIEVNLNANFVLSREFGKDMLARGYGKIIFTASVQSFRASEKCPAYAASKGGLAQLLRTLTNVWAARGVNVNAIAPGWVRTKMTDPIADDPERDQSIMASIPAGRWGVIDDFKGVAVFLASSASDYMHGQLVVVDGGLMVK